MFYTNYLYDKMMNAYKKFFLGFVGIFGYSLIILSSYPFIILQINNFFSIIGIPLLSWIFIGILITLYIVGLILIIYYVRKLQ